VNDQVARYLSVPSGRRLLWDVMSPGHVFKLQPARLEAWLERTGAHRVVHGHKPHGRPEPHAYNGGRAINFDGGLSRYGGRRFRRPSPARATVGPVPADSPEGEPVSL